MTEIKNTAKVRRGRIFPEIQWTQEQKAQSKAELEARYQRCKVIFDCVQSELIETHHNLFMAVEPDSGDYFIDKDEEVVTQMCLQKHPNAIPFIFVINETGGSWQDMIEGSFGSDGELFFEIELIAAEGLELPVSAMLDTGFTELLAVNSQDLEALGWHYLRERQLLTAQGITIFRIYLGKVRLDEQEFEIPIYAGNHITEVLLGSQWLKTMRLIADMPSGMLTLGTS